MSFFQAPPCLSNLYLQDSALHTELNRRLPETLRPNCYALFDQMGSFATHQLLEWLMEAEENPPVHVPFDPWGRRIDKIITSRAWDSLKSFSAGAGIVASGYKGDYGDHIQR